MKPVVAIYDACVLFPPSLRDLLVWLSIVGVCRARWSDAIHEEWIHAVSTHRPNVQLASLQRCRELMDASVPDSLVVDYEGLIPTLVLPDPDDRHVLAAAILGGTDCIVTFNLKDFPTDILAAHGIEAIHPDDFVVGLLEQSPESVCLAVRSQRELLKAPPKSAGEHLATLKAVGLTRTAELLQTYVDSI